MALAKAGTTVRAASTLHLTQPAVSRALLTLEEKLGTTLFERRPRGLVPTEAGTRVIDGAGSILAALVALEASARGPTRREPIRIVCECYTAYKWLPSALQALERAGTELDVQIAFEHTRAPIDGLLAGDVDVALLTTAKTPKNLVERSLWTDEICFFVAPTHPLASKPFLTLDDLESYPLVVSSQTPQPERDWFFKRVWGRRKPRTIERLQLPLTEAIVDATRAGMGIAILSEWIALPYLGAGDLVTKRLRSGPIERPWRIAFAKDASAAAHRLAMTLAAAAPRLYEPKKARNSA